MGEYEIRIGQFLDSDYHKSATGKATLLGLLDDLIGEGKDPLRDRQSQHGGGFKIDHELKPGRLLDRQIGGSGALQDLVDERGSALEILLEQLSVGQQIASLDKLAPLVNRRQAVLRCKREHPGPILDDWGTRFHQNCLVLVGCTGGEKRRRFLALR